MNQLSLFAEQYWVAAIALLCVVGCASVSHVPSITEANYRTLTRTVTTPVPHDGLNGIAQNPIVSHIFTADPSARVFDGRIYVYASHDLDDQQGYNMLDYHVFSSSDLVNWQDHGVALQIEDVPWAEALYAPDAAYSPVTKKYYLYFPDSGNGIGVAVADTPYGPFVDAIGKPLITRDTPGVEDVEWVFDPACFIDDDGEVYLYFGGGMPGTGDNARVIRLNEDMISLKDEAATKILAPDYFEAPFVHKKNGKYYFSYSTTFKDHPPYIDYMTSDHPVTGWTHQGTVIKNPLNNRDNNNHHSIVEYEGHWYIFYHNRMISVREGLTEYQRNIAIDTLAYEPDGAIREVPVKSRQVRQLRSLNAHSVLQAETLATQRGIEVDFIQADGRLDGVMVTGINNEDWIGYSQVDFGGGVNAFTARVASGAERNAVIDVYIDGCDLFSNLPGQRIGMCLVTPTGGWRRWKDVTCAIENTTGVHDVYLRFVGSGPEPLLNLDYFQFR